MQDYTRLYRKSMYRDRPPQKIREWCNPWAEAKYVHRVDSTPTGYLTRLNCVT